MRRKKKSIFNTVTAILLHLWKTKRNKQLLRKKDLLRFWILEHVFQSLFLQSMLVSNPLKSFQVKSRSAVIRIVRNCCLDNQVIWQSQLHLMYLLLDCNKKPVGVGRVSSSELCISLNEQICDHLFSDLDHNYLGITVFFGLWRCKLSMP